MNRTTSPGFPGLPQSVERSRPYGTECRHGHRPCPDCDAADIARQPPFDLRAAAEELLGEQWLQPLATMLGINPRTLQRWAAGQNRAPEPIAARISELLAIVRRCRADAAADRDRRAREAAAG